MLRGKNNYAMDFYGWLPLRKRAAVVLLDAGFSWSEIVRMGVCSRRTIQLAVRSVKSAGGRLKCGISVCGHDEKK